MKRYFRIFLLSFQDVLTDRSKALIWTLMGITGPLLMILFWRGALSGGKTVGGWSFGEIALYYLLGIMAGAILMTHIEQDIMQIDIKKGQLVKYLLKPLPYFLAKLYLEGPYRLLQGFWAIIVLLILSFFFGYIFKYFPVNFSSILLGIVISFLGFSISYIFKMIVGLSALWWEDSSSLSQFIEIITAVLCGFIMPIQLFPPALQFIANATPFPYMIYYPVIAFLGKLTFYQGIQIIITQVVWISLLSLLYRVIWAKGIKRFTGVGN